MTILGIYMKFKGQGEWPSFESMLCVSWDVLKDQGLPGCQISTTCCFAECDIKLPKKGGFEETRDVFRNCEY